jgi:hypothetical protein
LQKLSILEHPELREVTRDILSCRRCVEGELLYKPWIAPRGWAGLPKRDRVELVFVALNPGHPLPYEVELLKNLGLDETCIEVTDDQVTGVNGYGLSNYQCVPKGPSGTFHAKSVALAHSLLWLMSGQEPGDSLWEKCWFTDAFKCSTRKESAPAISRAAFSECRPHLERELSACSPKLVVTLGKSARRVLSDMHRYPIVHFRHPSNGCPRLDSTYHDDAFQQAADALGVEYHREQFRERRRLCAGPARGVP